MKHDYSSTGIIFLISFLRAFGSFFITDSLTHTVHSHLNSLKSGVGLGDKAWEMCADTRRLITSFHNYTYELLAT